MIASTVNVFWGAFEYMQQIYKADYIFMTNDIGRIWVEKLTVFSKFKVS